MFKKQENNKPRVRIKVKYNIGSKPHEEEFKSYALLGKWIIKNYGRVRIVNIDAEGNY